MILKKICFYLTLLSAFIVFNANAEEELIIGMDAPNFTLIDQDNIERSLSDYKNKWLVLYFYPKDDTP